MFLPMCHVAPRSYNTVNSQCQLSALSNLSVLPSGIKCSVISVTHLIFLQKLEKKGWAIQSISVSVVNLDLDVICFISHIHMGNISIPKKQKKKAKIWGKKLQPSKVTEMQIHMGLVLSDDLHVWQNMIRHLRQNFS